MLKKNLDNKKLLLVTSPFILVLIVTLTLVIYFWGSPAKIFLDLFKDTPISSVETPATPLGPAVTSLNYSESSDLPKTAKKGTLKVLITDPKPTSSPSPKNKKEKTSTELDSLIINISHAEVHLAQLAGVEDLEDTEVKSETTPSPSPSPKEDESKEEGEKVDKWETLNLSDTSFDLIDLKNRGGATEELGITSLAAGHYTQIRLFISMATGVTQDGKTVNLEISGQRNMVKIVREFKIEEGGTTTITVDFDAVASTVYSGGRYRLRPIVGKIIIEKPDGTKEEDTDV